MNRHRNHTTIERTDGYGQQPGTILTICLMCDYEIIGKTTVADRQREHLARWNRLINSDGKGQT